MDCLVVLADDFTGACDAAGALARTRSTLVLLAPPVVWPSAPGGTGAVEVVSIDLDVRERSDDDARQVTLAAAERVMALAPAARPFLKIDSTLRGPVAGLVAGALAGSGRSVAVLAPAFPEQGRLFVDGAVVLDGQTGPNLRTLLGVQDTVVLGADIACSADSLEAAIDQACRHGARYVVVDTDAPRCLASVANAWTRHPAWLLVGSGGLARHLSDTSPHAVPDASRLSAPAERAGPGPLLIVAGSPTPMTRAQIEVLRPLGPFTVVETAARQPPLPPPHTDLLVLCTPPSDARDAGENARAVADTVLEWSKHLRPGAVILAGGATARLVCLRLGAIGVELHGEFRPGIPIGRLVGGAWDGVSVVTKAGGFGAPTTLLDAVRALVP